MASEHKEAWDRNSNVAQVSREIVRLSCYFSALISFDHGSFPSKGCGS